MSSSDPSAPEEAVADASATDATPADGARRSIGSRGLRLIPWAVTLAALGWIGWTTDFDGIVDAVAGANAALFFGAMMGLYVVLWFVDSVAIAWVYRRYHAPNLRVRDVVPVRGATYILGILNYAVGAAAMALYFRRKHRVGLVEGGASLLVLMAVDFGLAMILVIVGGAVLPDGWREITLVIGAIFALAVIGHLLFWRGPWTWGPLERVRQHPKLGGFRDATIADYATMAALRAPVVGLYVCMHLATLAAFDIDVPLARLLVYVPVQMVIAALPLSVGGLGTVQAAQRVFYGPWVDTTGVDAAAGVDPSIAIVDAYALTLFFGFLVPRVLIGLGCLRAVGDALAETPGPDSPSSSEPTP